MFELGDLLAGLELEDLGDSRFRAPNMDYYGKSAAGSASPIADVIAGGQLLAQGLVAAHTLQPTKVAKSIHAVFARSGRVSSPTEIEVETVQDGRSTGTLVMRFVQQGRAFATATVLTHAPDPDVIRHDAPMRPIAAAEDPATRLDPRGPYEMGYVAGSELQGADEVAPAEQPMWIRFPDAPGDEVTKQALLAFATNFQLVGIAMRPHAGLSIEQSHVGVSTGVLSHTVSFHESFDATDWLLMDQDVPWAGRGRFFGHGNVFTADGHVVASFVQEGLLRALAESRGSGATL